MRMPRIMQRTAAGIEAPTKRPGLRNPPQPLAPQLSAGASDHAARFTWAATARGTLEVLAAEAMLRRRHP